MADDYAPDHAKDQSGCRDTGSHAGGEQYCINTVPAKQQCVISHQPVHGPIKGSAGDQRDRSGYKKDRDRCFVPSGHQFGIKCQ